jgi:hypothetical protein
MSRLASFSPCETLRCVPAGPRSGARSRMSLLATAGDAPHRPLPNPWRRQNQVNRAWSSGRPSLPPGTQRSGPERERRYAQAAVSAMSSVAGHALCNVPVDCSFRTAIEQPRSRRGSPPIQRIVGQSMASHRGRSGGCCLRATPLPLGARALRSGRQRGPPGTPRPVHLVLAAPKDLVSAYGTTRLTMLRRTWPLLPARDRAPSAVARRYCCISVERATSRRRRERTRMSSSVLIVRCRPLARAQGPYLFFGRVQSGPVPQTTFARNRARSLVSNIARKKGALRGSGCAGH